MLRKNNNINKTLSCFFVTEDPKISFVVVKKETYSHWKKVNKKLFCFKTLSVKLFYVLFWMFYFSQFVFYFVLWIGNKGLWKKTQFHRFPLSVKVLFLLGFFILWSVFFFERIQGDTKLFQKLCPFFVMHNMYVCPDVSTLIYYLFFFLLFHRKGTSKKDFLYKNHFLSISTRSRLYA